MLEKHSFIFPIAKLQERLEKHTSTLGKYRSSENMPNMIEQFSFTKAEEFLLDDYLPEAATKTFDWIKAFSRNLSDGYSLYHSVPVREVHDSDKLFISLDGMRIGETEARIPLGYEDMYSVEAVEGEEGKFRVTLHLPHLHIHKGDAISFAYELCVYYTTLADETFEDGYIYCKDFSSLDDVDIEEYSFEVNVPQDEFNTVVSRVDGLRVFIPGYVPSESYKKGELIDFETTRGEHYYGIQQSDGDEVKVEKWYTDDIRDSIVYRVELPEWQDRNMLPAAEDSLWWALTYYIMYKWFENVNPKEANDYLDKWEKKAHEAQLYLNRENKILQRKSKWL